MVSHVAETEHMEGVITSAVLIHPAREKLHALTSLRFFAAAMIVVYHSAVPFGVLNPRWLTIRFDAGVSFFFVLSGFILTHAYWSLDMRGAGRFLVARVARI